MKVVPYYSGIHVVTTASGFPRGIDRVVVVEVPILKLVFCLVGIDTVLVLPLELEFTLFGFATVHGFGVLMVPVLAVEVFGLNGGISGT